VKIFFNRRIFGKVTSKEVVVVAWLSRALRVPLPGQHAAKSRRECCEWVVGRLGVAACPACVAAAAVDRQAAARRSCLVWCGGVN